METALKEKVSPEKVREMVARGCTFQELVDTFENPREQRQKAKIHYGESNKTYNLLYNSFRTGKYTLVNFYDTKEEAVVDLAYQVALFAYSSLELADTNAPANKNTPVNENRKNMDTSYAVDIFKDGDVYKYSIRYNGQGRWNGEVDKENSPTNIISSIPDEFLSSDIEKNVITVGREKCLMCEEGNEVQALLYPNLYPDEKIYYEEKWGLPHKVCLDSYVKKLNDIKETALDTKDNNLLSIVEADILTLKNGPEIFEKGKRLDIGYDFEKYVYQVGKLTKEANESGVFPGKAFVVAAFDPKKKEFEQVYRLNVNCENEKVFTETAKFVSRNTDMRQPLGETMTDEFIEKIEKFAKKQEKAVGKKQPAKTL